MITEMLNTEPSRTKHKTTQKESIYQKSLFVELKTKSLLVEREKQFKLGFLVNFGESNGVNIIRRIYGNINSA